MKYPAITTGLALAAALSLTACNNQPDEDPDAPVSAEDEEAIDDLPDLDDPVGDETPPSDIETPSTMESGSNNFGGEGEGAPDPAKSKLQPADPPS